MSSILSITPEQYNKPLDFLDALGFGGQMLLLGIVSVFAVLGIILAILTIFKMVFDKQGSTKSSASTQTVAPAPVITPVSQDAEIVAVIAAAIAMAESESGENVKFRVVSFRRK